MSPEDRYCRFCIPATDDFIKKYVESAEGYFYGVKQYVTPKADSTGGILPLIYLHSYWEAAAVIHIAPEPKRQTMEIAVSVLPEYKGRGYAKQLMYFAMGMAEVYRCNSVYVVGLSQNSPMINLASDCGYSVKSDHGEFEGQAVTISKDITEIISNNIKLFKLTVGN